MAEKQETLILGVRGGEERGDERRGGRRGSQGGRRVEDEKLDEVEEGKKEKDFGVVVEREGYPAVLFPIFKVSGLAVKKGRKKGSE